MTPPTPVALITGGARRIGSTIARQLHRHQYRLIIHYRHSKDEAQSLVDELNGQRAHSAALLQADLNNDHEIAQLAKQAVATFGRIDALINNASSFYPTPVAQASVQQWDDLMNSNAKAPLFLSKALVDELTLRHGTIINIADIYADRPLKEHTIYCMAKAANVMLTKSLARELAPQVRVNGVAPGPILWPEQEATFSAGDKKALLERIPLDRIGDPDHIARTVQFLIDNDYITGQIIAVDGGHSAS